MAKHSKSPQSAIKPQRDTPVRIVRVEDDAPEPPAIDDSGLSLEELGQAYAAVLNRGEVPYEDQASRETELSPEVEDDVEELEASSAPVDDTACDLSPRSILEAMLFVGHPQDIPLEARQVAALMRGVLPEEIDDLVRDLNQQYAEEDCPYQIVSEDSGYRLVLREEFADVRGRFYGRVREARLSQQAIDTLAIVAYHQGVSVKEVDQLRGKPSGGILSQLVRRQLVRIERDPAKPRESHYRTTTRFLDLFGLDSIDDLPRSQDGD